MEAPRRRALHKVVVLARDGLIPLELSIPHRLFGQARTPDGAPLYEVVTVTSRPGPVRTDGDFTLNVAKGLDHLSTADTIVITASDEDYGPPTQGRLDPAVAEALATVRPETRMASICTGSFVLAASGFLDGRRATTHWRSADDFRRLFPHIELDPNVLYTDCDGVLTSAGVASGVDLCVHMIRCDHGSAVANEVARRTVVPPHRSGEQAQYIRRLVPEPETAATWRSRAWALEHLDRQISLAEMAAASAVSKRTFTRRFREETGLSPMRWLADQRVQRARELLEQTDLPIDRIAAASGLGTGAAMRQHFQAVLGVSPTAYRASFRSRGRIEPAS
jgi:transcriptional regulator GlxA family with amidase domain